VKEAAALNHLRSNLSIKSAASSAPSGLHTEMTLTKVSDLTTEKPRSNGRVGTQDMKP